VVNRSQGADNRPRLGSTVAQLWRSRLLILVTAPGSISGHELREGRDHDPLRAGGSHASGADLVAAFGAEERLSAACDVTA
jgi:hypothetical protein